MMKLPALIRKLRIDKEWSQGQLAIKSGLIRSYISALETGRIEIVGTDKLFKLAKALDVDNDLLLEAAGIKKPVTADKKVVEKVETLSLYLLGNQATETEVETLLTIAKGLLAQHGTKRNLESESE